MSITYTPTTNFGSKDSLPSNDPNKVIRGAEFTTEFTAIQSAFGLAAPASNPTFTGTATFDNVTASTVSLGSVTASSLTVNGAFTSPGIDDNATSTAITIKANEHVGIGTSNPAATFEVNDGTQASGSAAGIAPDALIRGTGNTGLSIFTDATSTASIAFGKQASSTNARWIKADNSADTLGFGRGESAADLTISSSGDVGIGQTNPVHILDLKDATPIINMEHAAGGGSRIYFDDATDGAWGAINANYGSGGSSKEIKIAPNSAIGDARFGGMTVKKDVVQVGGDFQQTRLEANDNIKVTGSGKQIIVDDTGTNNVNAYMTAAGTIGGFVASRGAPNDSEVRLEAKGNVGSLTMTGRDGLSTEIQCESAGNLVFNMDGTEAMRIRPTGTVGVGTSLPNNTSLMELQATSANGRSGSGLLRLTNTEAPGVSVGYYGTSNDYVMGIGGTGDFSLYDVTAATTPFTVSANTPANTLKLASSGAIGVGTASPSSSGLMEIQANSVNGKSGSGLLRLTNTQSNIAAITFDTTGNDYSIGSSGSNLFNVYDITNASTPFAIEPNTPSGTLKLSSAGRVGIGTTSPQTTLHVEQTTDAASDGFRLSRSNSNASYSQWIDGNSNWNIGYSNPSTADPTTPSISILTSGDVGINQASPQRPLHVSSVMRLEPRATAPSNPSAGDIYFSSVSSGDGGVLRCYDGAAWQDCF